MFLGLGNHLGLFSQLPDEPEHQQWHVQQGCGQPHDLWSKLAIISLLRQTQTQEASLYLTQKPSCGQFTPRSWQQPWHTFCCWSSCSFEGFENSSKSFPMPKNIGLFSRRKSLFASEESAVSEEAQCAEFRTMLWAQVPWCVHVLHTYYGLTTMFWAHIPQLYRYYRYYRYYMYRYYWFYGYYRLTIMSSRESTTSVHNVQNMFRKSHDVYRYYGYYMYYGLTTMSSLVYTTSLQKVLMFEPCFENKSHEVYRYYGYYGLTIMSSRVSTTSLHNVQEFRLCYEHKSHHV